MHISEKGLRLIKNFEGCKLTAYICPAGKYTIGYGHTAGVKQGMTITQKQGGLQDKRHRKAEIRHANRRNKNVQRTGEKE